MVDPALRAFLTIGPKIAWEPVVLVIGRGSGEAESLSFPWFDIYKLEPEPYTSSPMVSLVHMDGLIPVLNEYNHLRQYSQYCIMSTA